MKRGRNQRRRQGANPNRALDSNGPEVRIRGTANQIYDKYITLARDASSSGDRVKAENYQQHAEHYFRLIRSMQSPQQSSNVDADGEQPSVDDQNDRGGNDRGGDRNGGDRSGGDRRRRRDKNGRDNDAKAADDGQVDADADSRDDDASKGDASKGDEEKPKRKRARRSAKSAVEEEESSPEDDTPAAAAQ